MFHSADYLDDFFGEVIRLALGETRPVIGYRILTGGCVHNTLLLSTPDGPLCLKYNDSHPVALLEAEAEGLHLLRRAEALRVPAVLGVGETEGKAWLLIEYLEAGPRKPPFWEELGQGLALLHGHSAPAFGAEADNYIGSLPQPNAWQTDGPTFFAEQRLLHQAGQALLTEDLPLATFKQIEQLASRLHDFLPAERPSLVHGDLWSGNLLVDEAGAPALIDPAAHYGLREAEVAFTSLFGGFDDDFYAAYQEAFPLEPGFEQRRDLYNLYPLLVHLRLFGSGYLAGIQQIVDQLIK